VKRRQLVQTLTIVCLASAVVTAVIGLFLADASSKIELGVEAFAIVAAISGIFAERRAAAAERRASVLSALASELRRNGHVLADPRFIPMDVDARPRARVYPRLLVSASETALISGALESSSDEQLVHLLHTWRDTINEFHQRLSIAELRAFINLDPEEILNIDQVIHEAGGFLDRLGSQLDELSAHLPL
jgi:hypothetical protein